METLEVRVLDLIKMQVLSGQEATEALIDFSLSRLGSKTLILELIKICLDSWEHEGISIRNSNLLLNHFNSEIWSHDQD
jgi:hypothetical protein